MTVHALNIESRSNPNDYVVRLENPIYDVTEIKLVSARIPTPQLTICDTNNTFSIGERTVVTLTGLSFESGETLANVLEFQMQPFVDSITFDTDTLTFSNTLGHAFTLEFSDESYIFLGFDSNFQESTSDGILVPPDPIILLEKEPPSFDVEISMQPEQFVTLPNSNYTSGSDLAAALQTHMAPRVDSVVFDPTTNRLEFSNTTQRSFTLEFKTGISGFDDIGNATTPHQVLGFGSDDYHSTDFKLVSGAINIAGPNSLLIRVSAGSDEFNQSVFTGTPFYTGHILLDGTSTLNFNGNDDHMIHTFHSGPQKYIRDIRIEFFYMSHGRRITYDFMNQDHILKFELACSTDKLQNLPKVPIPDSRPFVNVPEHSSGGIYEWRVVVPIIMVVLLGIVILFSMRRGGGTGREFSE